MFTVFKRAWWRCENTRYNGRQLVSNPGGTKRTLATFETEQEARNYCREWNDTHDPGVTSIKAEYSSH